MVVTENPSQGVLIDFDFAAQVNQDGSPMNGFLPSPGTITFRAIDLLNDDQPTRSYYRHDLESFFYVLVWMLQSRTPEKPEIEFELWFRGDWHRMRI